MNLSEPKEIAFFGKITAATTHEMKNILAIIKESSGLMEDLLLMSQNSPAPYQEKFQNALSVIKNQVKRGVDLTNRLNRFAHSPDETTSAVDLFELSENLVMLSRRFATLKQVALTTRKPNQTITIITNPVQLQMALLASIDCCLKEMPPRGELIVSFEKNGEQTAVHLTCKGDLPEKSKFDHTISVSNEWAALQRITSDLSIIAKSDESAPGILLIFS
jgi:signal transduction histidine kinase